MRRKVTIGIRDSVFHDVACRTSEAADAGVQTVPVPAARKTIVCDSDHRETETRMLKLKKKKKKTVTHSHKAKSNLFIGSSNLKGIDQRAPW